jgi:PAS domain S-box-containing protein
MDSIITAHKHVEQALQYLTVIAEHSRQGVVVVDLNRTIRFTNVAWATMHGYEDRQQLIGKQIDLFHTKEQMETDVIPFIEEVKQRGRLSGPVGHVRRNGEPFTAEMSMVIFRDQMGRMLGLIGFAEDVTELQRTKDELRQYRNHLAELLERQTSRLKAAYEQLQHEITEQKSAEQYFRQQIDELKLVNQQLQNQINKLSASGNITETDTSKMMVPSKTTASFSNDEKSILINVFKENIALQKPELIGMVVDENVP